MPSKRAKETLESKLRNALGPVYNLAELVLLNNDDPRLKKAIKQIARQAIRNKKKIDTILVRMSKRYNNQTNGRSKK